MRGVDIPHWYGIWAPGRAPAAFAAFLKSEVVRWTEVARNAGLEPNGA